MAVEQTRLQVSIVSVADALADANDVLDRDERRVLRDVLAARLVFLAVRDRELDDFLEEAA